MRIKSVQAEHNQPYSEDVVVIIDSFDSIWRVPANVLTGYLMGSGEMCEYCEGSGKVRDGEHDDVVMKPCLCQI